MNRIICSLVVTAVLANMSGSANAVVVVGAPYCGKWVEERPKKNVESIGYEYWLIGFLSGIAVTLGKDFLTNIDNPSLFLWADNYCRANPLSNLAEAGQKLSRELMRQQKKL